MKNLVNKVVNTLHKKKILFSCAESCTGGMLSSEITSVNGSSKVFIMGIVTYSNISKIKILKISKKIIKNYGAVSRECCLSITGIAGPSGGTKKKPIGLVYIGIKKGNKINVHKCFFKNKGREYIRKATVKKSLNLIFSIIK